MDAESVLKRAEQAAGAAGVLKRGAAELLKRLQHASLGLGGRPANPFFRSRCLPAYLSVSVCLSVCLSVCVCQRWMRKVC